MKRIMATFFMGSWLWSCQESPDRLAGGADDHGNAVSARIVVVDSVGRPVPNAQVEILPSNWIPGAPLDTLSQHPNAVVDSTDPSGICLVENLRPGKYRFLASTSTYAATVEVNLAASQTISLSAYLPGAIDGKLFGAQAGTPVFLEGTSLKTTIGEEGGFRIARVPAGFHRIHVGFRSQMILDQIPLHPRRISRIQDLTFDSLATTRLIPIVHLTTDLLPPTVSPAPGTYQGMLRIQLAPPFADDLVEVSLDGGEWKQVTDGIRLARSTCLAARSRRGESTSAPTTPLCYSIE